MGDFPLCYVYLRRSERGVRCPKRALQTKAAERLPLAFLALQFPFTDRSRAALAFCRMQRALARVAFGYHCEGNLVRQFEIGGRREAAFLFARAKHGCPRCAKINAFD